MGEEVWVCTGSYNEDNIDVSFVGKVVTTSNIDGNGGQLPIRQNQDGGYTATKRHSGIRLEGGNEVLKTKGDD